MIPVSSFSRKSAHSHCIFGVLHNCIAAELRSTTHCRLHRPQSRRQLVHRLHHCFRSPFSFHTFATTTLAFFMESNSVWRNTAVCIIAIVAALGMHYQQPFISASRLVRIGNKHKMQSHTQRDVPRTQITQFTFKFSETAERHNQFYLWKMI